VSNGAQWKMDGKRCEYEVINTLLIIVTCQNGCAVAARCQIRFTALYETEYFSEMLFRTCTKKISTSIDCPVYSMLYLRQ
jgi:hypothetical protein